MSTKHAMAEDYREGLEAALKNPISRRILIALADAGEEVAYEQLRSSVGKPAPQVFNNAFDRIHKQALIARRLEPAGNHYRSHISLTPLGKYVAKGLRIAAGDRTSKLPKSLQSETRRVLLGAEEQAAS